MSFEARWIVSTPASSLHAAACLIAGLQPVEPGAIAGVAEQAAALGVDLDAAGLAPEPFFAHAIPLAARLDTPERIVEVTLTKLQGDRASDVAAARLTRTLRALFAAVAAARPDLLHELELRSLPLREQWEARGGGLLAAVRHFSESQAVVEEADVLLVAPFCGGAGAAHPAYNAVRIEAVLANPHAALPEVVRLGCLWSQLNFDLPRYHDALPPEQLAATGRLALVPVVLAAASEVELARCDRASVAMALEAWQLPAIDVDTLWSWWETYHTAPSSWPAAIAALAHMLA